MSGDTEWVRLGRSQAWTSQRDFYESLGVSAWHRQVPDFVSSNAFLASHYAKLVLAFAMDCGPQGGKVLVVELAAGHGKLGFLVVSKLLEMRSLWPNPEVPPFKYVLTDGSRRNIDHYMSHPQLSALFHEGVLDVAYFDAEQDTTLEFSFQRDTTISPRQPWVGPIMVVANYALDSLCQDAFVTSRKGDVAELFCRARNVSVDSRRLEMKWSWQLGEPLCGAHEPYHIKVDDYAFTERLCEFWADYKGRLANMNREGSVLIPVGGLRGLWSLIDLTDHAVCVLVGDKGDTSLEDAITEEHPQAASHGSFSFMVNFDAVESALRGCRPGKFVTYHSSSLKGFKVSCYLVPPQRRKRSTSIVWDTVTSLVTSNTPRNQVGFPSVALEWMDGLGRLDPESFTVIQRSIDVVQEQGADIDIKLALALLRLGEHDSDIFYRLRHVFIKQSHFLQDRARCDLVQDLQVVFTRYFHGTRSNCDVPFELGRVFMGLRKYKLAGNMFFASMDLFQAHYTTLYNIGICKYHQSDLEAAFQHMKSSVQLNPSFGEARTWLSRLEREKRQSES